MSAVAGSPKDRLNQWKGHYLLTSLSSELNSDSLSMYYV